MLFRKLFQLVCMFAMTAPVTCDSDVTKDTLSSLQQQMQTLQVAFQSQNAEIHELKAENKELKVEQQNQKERIDYITAENNELKDYLQLQLMTKQKRVSDDAAGIGFTTSMSSDAALGDHQIIMFDTILTNDGNGYDSRHGHFTAPVTGLYAFSVTVMCVGNESNLHVAIMKDGQRIGRVFANGNNYDNGSKLVVVQLDAGQMVWVEHEFDPSGYKIHGNGHSAFSGFLIMAY
ncbi:complement C1q tumor necrosis factor-related protein 7-like [Argopecten irradians]|uniref:complement C1q tumor necrosis factor-related protein 7-like n=1 Tax=Argopecten irradians TaxID=31199 RepID=UPI003722643D